MSRPDFLLNTKQGLQIAWWSPGVPRYKREWVTCFKSVSREPVGILGHAKVGALMVFEPGT